MICLFWSTKWHETGDLFGKNFSCVSQNKIPTVYYSHIATIHQLNGPSLQFILTNSLATLIAYAVVYTSGYTSSACGVWRVDPGHMCTLLTFGFHIEVSIVLIQNQ